MGARSVPALAVPAMLAAWVVLSIYVDTPVGLPQTFRSLAVAITVALALQLVATITLRSMAHGSLAAGALVLVAGGFMVWVLIVAGVVSPRNWHAAAIGWRATRPVQ